MFQKSIHNIGLIENDILAAFGGRGERLLWTEYVKSLGH
jgi:hypothetical protein